MADKPEGEPKGKPEFKITRRVAGARSESTAARRAEGQETAAARAADLKRRGEEREAVAREAEARKPKPQVPFQREDLESIVVEFPGGRLRIGPPPFSASLRTLEMLGDTLSPVTESFTLDMLYVREIDGAAVEAIDTLEKRDMLAARLGELGIDAARGARSRYFPPLLASEFTVVERVMRRR